MKSQTAVERILATLAGPLFKEARFFLSADVCATRADPAGLMALSRLCQLGRIQRVSAGIYTQETSHMPDSLAWVDELAVVAARRSSCTVRIDGRRMAMSLGLSLCEAKRHIYMSDGGAAKLQWDGHEIEIRRVRPSLLVAAQGEAGRLVQAIYWLGPEGWQAAGHRHVRYGKGEREICSEVGHLLSHLPPWAASIARSFCDTAGGVHVVDEDHRDGPRNG